MKHNLLTFNNLKEPQKTLNSNILSVFTNFNIVKNKRTNFTSVTKYGIFPSALALACRG